MNAVRGFAKAFLIFSWVLGIIVDVGVGLWLWSLPTWSGVWLVSFGLKCVAWTFLSGIVLWATGLVGSLMVGLTGALDDA